MNLEIMIKLNYFFLLLLATLSRAVIIKEQMCGALKKLEDESKSLLENTKCSINGDCTLLNCKGKFKEKTYEMAAEIKVCDHPPVLILSGNLPQFDINHWNYPFNNSGPVNLQVSNLSEKFANSSLQINFTRDKDRFKLSFLVKGTSDSYKKEFEIPFKECPHNDIEASSVLPPTGKGSFDKNTKRTCQIANLTSCQDAEECTEIDKDSGLGECHCLPNFHLDTTTECVKDPTTIAPSSADSDEEGNSRSSKKASYILMGVFIPLAFIVLGGLFFAANRRYNLIGRFQRATRRYDEVLLDQSVINYDDDDDQPLA